MAQQQGFKLPLGLVLLDGLGAVLLGLGLAKLLADIDILPASLQFDHTGWTMILIGSLLMLPLLFWVLVQVRKRAEQKLVK